MDAFSSIFVANVVFVFSVVFLPFGYFGTGATCGTSSEQNFAGIVLEVVNSVVGFCVVIV